MLTLTCYYLLHHHFEATATLTDTISISSGCINDEKMSDDLPEAPENYQNQTIETLETVPTPSNIVLSQDDQSEDTTINPVDEDSQFLYSSDSESLICTGSNFDDIPQSIIDAYASKTKTLVLSQNRFRSLGFLRHFTELEELHLDANDLDDIHTHFPRLEQLKVLMMNKNRLQDIYKLVDQLRQSYPKLNHLSLLGNEACPYQIISTSSNSAPSQDSSCFNQTRLEEEYQRYRHLLIFRIPTLHFLDSRIISDEERRIATKLGDLVYSIAETRKNFEPIETDNSNEKREFYTPLPANTGKREQRTSMGKLKHTYNGEGSQGNKFLVDNDL